MLHKALALLLNTGLCRGFIKSYDKGAAWSDAQVSQTREAGLMTIA
jgi:hypothetical protein